MRFRARRPAIPPRTAIESPMGGKEARCARSSRTRGTRAMQSSGVGPRTKGSSTPMTWAPDTSCVFVGPTPTRSYVRENLRIPPSSRPPERFSDCCTMWQSRTVAVREDRRGPLDTGVGAVVDQASEWAAFDALLGIEVKSAPDATVGALAFYGRCSTEDNQDP